MLTPGEQNEIAKGQRPHWKSAETNVHKVPTQRPTSKKKKLSSQPRGPPSGRFRSTQEASRSPAPLGLWLHWGGCCRHVSAQVTDSIRGTCCHTPLLVRAQPPPGSGPVCTSLQQMNDSLSMGLSFGWETMQPSQPPWRPPPRKPVLAVLLETWAHVTAGCRRQTGDQGDLGPTRTR